MVIPPNSRLLFPVGNSDTEYCYSNALAAGAHLQSVCGGVILVRMVDIHECGFQDGGCRLLAQALVGRFPNRLRLVATYRKLDGQMNHVCAQIVGHDLYLDSDGICSGYEMGLKTAMEDEGFEDVVTAFIDENACGLVDEVTEAWLRKELVERLPDNFVDQAIMEAELFHACPDGGCRQSFSAT